MQRKYAWQAHVAGLAISALALLFVSASPCLARANLNDAQVRQRMIDDSIRNYRGNCPCPYNLASNGSKCGKRSAYSKPGGASPLCYPEYINDQAVRAWRQANQDRKTVV